jgi:hypothetical protein
LTVGYFDRLAHISLLCRQVAHCILPSSIIPLFHADFHDNLVTFADIGKSLVKTVFVENKLKQTRGLVKETLFDASRDPSSKASKSESLLSSLL